jgi:hypothetical protein
MRELLVAGSAGAAWLFGELQVSGIDSISPKDLTFAGILAGVLWIVLGRQAKAIDKIGDSMDRHTEAANNATVAITELRAEVANNKCKAGSPGL